MVGEGLSTLITAFASGANSQGKVWVSTLWSDLSDLINLAAWILLMGWFAALMPCAKPQTEATAGSSLPESGNDAGGNI